REQGDRERPAGTCTGVEVRDVELAPRLAVDGALPAHRAERPAAALTARNGRFHGMIGAGDGVFGMHRRRFGHLPSSRWYAEFAMSYNVAIAVPPISDADEDAWSEIDELIEAQGPVAP